MNDMKQSLDQAHKLVFQLEATSRFLELDLQVADERVALEYLMHGQPLGNPVSGVARVQQRLLSDLSDCLNNLEPDEENDIETKEEKAS